MTESGTVYDNKSVVEGIFTTEKYTWNTETSSYDTKTTQYYDADCTTVFEENV